MNARPAAGLQGAAHWDEVAASWEGGRPPLWRRQSDVVNALLVDRWLPPEGAGAVLKTDLFDEFAGIGLQPLLEARCDAVVGVDCSPLVVAGARRRYPRLQAKVADVRELPYEGATFDAVVSPSTLDHFGSPEAVGDALSELARVVRPGGTLIVTLDNPINPIVAVRNGLPERAARRLRRVPYDAGWTCGPARLGRMLAAAGFDVRERTAILHLPRVLVAELDRARRISRPGMWDRLFRGAERAGSLPTRYLTGHFVAARAVRRDGPPAS